jgi:hypothetical protein
MLLLAASLAAHAAPCDVVVEVVEVRAKAEAAWTAALTDRGAELREHVQWLEEHIGCVAGPLTTGDAAIFHRAQAMMALAAGDRRAAVAAAGAALRLAPEEVPAWGSTSAPFAVLASEVPTEVISDDFGTSLAARVYTDGRANASRFVGQPLVVQLFAPGGAPVAGAWIAAAEPLPDWVAFPPVRCASEVAVDSLLQHVTRAETAYRELDVATFEASLQAVAEELPCVHARIGTSQAAAVHRLEGLRQYTHGESTSAVRSFQNARGLDPVFTPSEAIVRPESRLEKLWNLAGQAPPSPWATVAVPPGLVLYVDGLGATGRPAATPSIVQLATGAGVVLSTQYVPVGAALPDLAPIAVESTRLAEESMPPALRLYREEGIQRRTHVRQTRLAAAGVAVLTGSAALYVVNVNAVAEYNDTDTPHTRLPGLQQRANAAATASSLLLATGAGLIAASIVFR